MFDYPNDQETERCAIGSMLCGALAGPLRAKHFYSEHHAAIFELLLRMRADHVPIDAVTVIHKASQEGLTISPSEMVGFLECCPHAGQMDACTSILIDCWRRRRRSETA